jgi:23S rRNA (adenine2030-N6)-methyltransferase
MLSYQHAYHAGNLADVHKHAVLAFVLDYLGRKDKPLTYLETHAGRALYDLAAPEAVRTGEAAAGIGRVGAWFAPPHPYGRVLAETRAARGPTAYPGSPLIAAMLLRPDDRMHLAELHPQERAALQRVLPQADIRAEDGVAMALSLCPPVPRRGLLLADPSYEVKEDYAAMARLMPALHRKWNVGVLILWYPLLDDARHEGMAAAIVAAIPGALRHEVRFAPARPGHRMTGSGLIVVNPPWGLAEETARLTRLYEGLVP